ncbi:glycine cleavage system H protein [Pseudomassariella vexata]|uniref:Glycine cleavage system H protein n=1 Tax=Pseudomassariella vexata TaxID=1141098 RepID=A0A1Y2EKI0_9PEZI|nr:glycine cleavage system H protein [Pseudomassariella vexata]ORY72047.1 glycine cleavage system H protein [Pseudomassariella vexata]
MATSVARCLRAACPSTLSRLTRNPSVRTSWQPSIRAFSATSFRGIRKYTKDHEWIDLNADKTSGVIGISEYAAEELGDVVYVELPEDGKVVGAGDAIGAVESVKSAADINAPISCKVTAINMVLEEKPGTINLVPEDDSHGGGWICKVSVDEQGVKDFEALMDAEAYKVFTGSEH